MKKYRVGIKYVEAVYRVVEAKNKKDAMEQLELAIEKGRLQVSDKWDEYLLEEINQ